MGLSRGRSSLERLGCRHPDTVTAQPKSSGPRLDRYCGPMTSSVWHPHAEARLTKHRGHDSHGVQASSNASRSHRHTHARSPATPVPAARNRTCACRLGALVTAPTCLNRTRTSPSGWPSPPASRRIRINVQTVGLDPYASPYKHHSMVRHRFEPARYLRDRAADEGLPFRRSDGRDHRSAKEPFGDDESRP